MPKPKTEVASNDMVAILLIHPGDHPDLLVEYLSTKLWMDHQSAQRLVHDGYGVINPKTSVRKATDELALMKALGAEVEIVEASKGKPRSLFDISVRRSRRSSITEIKGELKRLGFLGLPQSSGPVSVLVHDWS